MLEKFKMINKRMHRKDKTMKEEYTEILVNTVDWNKVSKYQNLSEDFIREFKDKLNLES